MTERTRRATEVVDAQATYIEQCLTGGSKDAVESPILDVTRDPNDPRYGHQDFLYGLGRDFQGWMKHLSSTAQSFTATTDLFREVMLSVEMMTEEGLEFLPLTEDMLPAPCGFFLFPYGVRNPHHIDDGIETRRDHIGEKRIDYGGGNEHWIDGFIWERSQVVARDGHHGTPKPGISVILLTRWRGNPEHRPYRLAYDPAIMKGRAPVSPPPIVGSDLTGWSFDEPGQDAWVDPVMLNVGNPTQSVTAKYPEHLANMRWLTRSIVWATFRWLTDEVWLPERADRASERRMKRARPVLHENILEDGHVVIADLRKERREEIERFESTGEPPWWRTRWIVRDHYARRRFAIRGQDNKPVGPTRGPDAVEGVTFEYRKVFIAAHVKGPSDAPLVYRDVVGVLDR